ncbi:imidazole glycerol phosphate synthase subunit HisH [bacterium]|nr:imidazole glycerol phosphate synthase subunit HisH [bacterium]
MIGILDYGLGNIRAFANIYKNLDMPYRTVSCVNDFEGVSKIILPGVGAFDHAMDQLNQSGLRDRLDELVLVGNLPVMGICVGMQMMAEDSEEGQLPGLGWIKGHVRKMDISQLTGQTRLPHMGWNSINPLSNNSILSGFSETPRFYFLHSFYFNCTDQTHCIATSVYGKKFSCAVNRANVFGIQFHPEKSHQNGIQLLSNFGNLS